MTSSRVERTALARRPGVIATSMAALATAVAWIGTAVALELADGVRQLRPGGSEYETEFVEGWVYLVSAAAAVVLVVLAARFSWPPAAVGLVGLVAGLWWGGTETVQRYAESGWSDGLEVFVFVTPITAGLLGLVLVGALHAPRVRQSRPGATS